MTATMLYVWIHVILSIEKKQTDNGNSFSYRYIDKLAFRAKEQSFNLHTSMDMIINKLEKQLKKTKRNFKSPQKKTI
jgi:ribosomal subunit interface protein